MQWKDREIVELSTRYPELTPSEAAHVAVLRARCRRQRRRRKTRERNSGRSGRLRLLALAAALAGCVLLLLA